MADVDLAMANGTVVAWVKRITLCLELGNDLLANLKAGLAPSTVLWLGKPFPWYRCARGTQRNSPRD